MDAETRKRAAKAAAADGHSLTAIAREIGTTGQNLSGIVRRGSQQSGFAAALDAWLQERGYDRSGECSEEAAAKDIMLKLQELAQNPDVHDENLTIVESLMSRMARYMNIQAQQHREFQSMYDEIEGIYEALRKE